MISSPEDDEDDDDEVVVEEALDKEEFNRRLNTRSFSRRLL